MSSGFENLGQLFFSLLLLLLIIKISSSLSTGSDFGVSSSEVALGKKSADTRNLSRSPLSDFSVSSSDNLGKSIVIFISDDGSKLPEVGNSLGIGSVLISLISLSELVNDLFEVDSQSSEFVLKDWALCTTGSGNLSINNNKSSSEVIDVGRCGNSSIDFSSDGSNLSSIGSRFLSLSVLDLATDLDLSLGSGILKDILELLDNSIRVTSDLDSGLEDGASSLSDVISVLLLECYELVEVNAAT